MTNFSPPSLRRTFAVLLTLFLLVPAHSLPVEAQEGEGIYIVPEADIRDYTEEEIMDMPLQVVCYAKNEIYARHGRRFRSSELAGYFAEQSWYSGTISPDSFSDDLFNDYEHHNVDLLNGRESELSDGAGYLLDQPGYSYEVVREYVDNYVNAQKSPDSEVPAETPVRTPREVTEEETAWIEEALNEYRGVVSEATSYLYNPPSDNPPSDGVYRYALVQMQAEDTVPTLLLEMKSENGLSFALVFQYDPENKTILSPADSVVEGASLAGGIRGEIKMQGDGNGIWTANWSSGTGDATLSRITIEGNTLKEEEQWSGRIDLMPEEFTSIDISWHDVQDLSALDSWTPEDFSGQTNENAEAQ